MGNKFSRSKKVKKSNEVHNFEKGQLRVPYKVPEEVSWRSFVPKLSASETPEITYGPNVEPHTYDIHVKMLSYALISFLL